MLQGEKGEERPYSITACSPKGSWHLSSSTKCWADCGCWLRGHFPAGMEAGCWFSAGKSFPLHPQKLNPLSPLNKYIMMAEGVFYLADDKEACEAFWGSELKKHNLTMPSVSLRWSSASLNLVWGVAEMPWWAGRELCRAPLSGSREGMGGQGVRWEAPLTDRVQMTLLPSCATDTREVPVWILCFQNLWHAFFNLGRQQRDRGEPSFVIKHGKSLQEQSPCAGLENTWQTGWHLH